MSQIDGLTKQTTSLKLLCTQDPRGLNELDKWIN